jgi:phosphatidylglycerol:prolipoprotein diacylglycerol transferase
MKSRAVRPYLFQLPDWLPGVGGRPLFSYGIFLGLAFIVGWSICVELCKRHGFRMRTLVVTNLSIVVAAILGARTLHYISSPIATFSVQDFFQFTEGGLVAYGGILGGILASMVALKAQRTDWWAYADNGAVGLAVGLGITRMGCFFFGCDYGVGSAAPWAVSFPRWDDTEVGPFLPDSSPAHADHVTAGLDALAARSDLVHATQLYESFAGFLGFVLILLWWPRKRFHGQLVLFFLGYYAVARFLIEAIRGDADRGDNVILGMSTSQAIGVLFVLGLAVAWWRQRGRGLYAASGTAFQGA